MELNQSTLGRQFVHDGFSWISLQPVWILRCGLKHFIDASSLYPTVTDKSEIYSWEPCDVTRSNAGSENLSWILWAATLSQMTSHKQAKTNKHSNIIHDFDEIEHDGASGVQQLNHKSAWMTITGNNIKSSMETENSKISMKKKRRFSLQQSQLTIKGWLVTK